MLVPGCGLRSWHIVQKERPADSSQTSFNAFRGGVPPPPPNSVTGPPASDAAGASDGAGAFGLPLTAATTTTRARAVLAAPRATQVVRRPKRPFFSELNGAPSAVDDLLRPEHRRGNRATARHKNVKWSRRWYR